jgi:glycerol-3-phosphate dehydrogenase
MKIGIVGGGINGLSCAWKLSQAGHSVDLYERDKLMTKTSQSSSKLLHGGLRYLEHGEFRLVREALRERDAWLQRVPSLTKPLRLVMPIYNGSRRARWKIGAGLFLYDHIAGRSLLPKSRWLSAKTLLERDPGLMSNGLKGGFEFSDGQMDDYQLGLWVAEQVRAAGGKLHEDTAVASVSTTGSITLQNGECTNYDRVINVCGPWAAQLLESSGLHSPYRLDTVRGSHLVIDQPCIQAYLLEAPQEERIIFALPWKGKTLLGTTEVRQALNEPVRCSDQEQDYLLNTYNHYRTISVSAESITDQFAGMRPLLSSANEPGRATREYAIQRDNKLINVFGGKWTTTLALAQEVTRRIQ